MSITQFKMSSCCCRRVEQTSKIWSHEAVSLNDGWNDALDEFHEELRGHIWENGFNDEEAETHAVGVVQFDRLVTRD